MKDFAAHLKKLISSQNFLISLHGYEEMENDDIMFSDIVHAMAQAEMIEFYPDYHKGPCGLFLLHDQKGQVHALWGMAKNTTEPAVLITAYRPDPKRWSTDFRRRQEHE